MVSDPSQTYWTICCPHSQNDHGYTLQETACPCRRSSMAAMMHQHNVSPNLSSSARSTTDLSMAETLVQGPPRSHTPPQVASPLEKSKVKTGQQQYPFSYSRIPSPSPHDAPANPDLPKMTSVNPRIVNASLELNGVSSAAEDKLSPSGSRVVLSPIGATTFTSMLAPSRNSSNNTMKRPTFQTQSRGDFFNNLSKKSFSRTPCSDACCHSGISCASGKFEVVTRNVTSRLKINAATEPLKFSSNGKQQYSNNNPVLFPDEEEIAFLRSLGWEESAGVDEGLTEEEIRDFHDKYMKLQPSNIVQKVHQNMIAPPLDSSSGGCGGAPLGLMSSA